MKRMAQEATRNNSQRRLDEETVKQMADEAAVDERTLLKRLAGLPVRGRAGQRIDTVLARRGL